MTGRAQCVRSRFKRKTALLNFLSVERGLSPTLLDNMLGYHVAK